MNWIISLLIGLFAGTGSVSVSKLDEILHHQAMAMGGSERLSGISSLRVELRIREPAFEVSAIYVASRQGNMRIDVFADQQRVFAEGLFDGHAWEWQPDKGRVEVGGVAAAALRHGIQKPGRFYTMEQLQSTGASLELMNDSGISPNDEWQIRVTLADGFVVDYFVHKATHLITRSRDVRAFHPTVDPEETTIETRYEEYEWVDGVLRNFVSENIDVVTGEWLGTSIVEKIEHNVEIEPAFFGGETGL